MNKDKKKIIKDKYAEGMFVRQQIYAQNVKDLFDKTVTELLDLVRQCDLDPEHQFLFEKQSKRISSEATKKLRELYSLTYWQIKSGILTEWELANKSCDIMIQTIFGKNFDSKMCARWFDRNKEAVDQFFKRTQAVGGLNLSQKVWKYTSGLRTELESAVTVAIGEGKSASEMSREVRKYLRDPEKLFRRVRDSKGKLHLSENAKKFHPSRGVYRSSYKNAMRLTVTETNAAYRAADEDRWQRLDFVIGYEIKKSNAHKTEDVCDLLCGKYPKKFKFTAWHPQCHCYVVPILCSLDEMSKMNEAILQGKDPASVKLQGEIKDVPKVFKQWISDNEDRIKKASVLPYFIAENYKNGNIDKGLRFKTE